MNPGSSAVASEPAAEEQTVRWLGIWLALVSAVLAFVLASTPAHQDEVWSHLARGRAFLVGQSPPDLDPQFLAPEVHTYRTLLYDLALFAGYRVFGGVGVAVLNAVLATLLALAVFRAGWTTISLVPAGLCSILTIVAMAPWFDVAPRMCSYLFLALTIVLVRKTSELVQSRGGLGRTRWAILVLFAIWANVDRWVVLGPITIGLLALAERYRGRAEVARSLAVLSLGGLFASLLSPNHIRVWNPASTIGSQSLHPHASPFSPDWYQADSLAVGVVYVILVLLGLLAFRRDSRGDARVWLPVWVALLALAVWYPASAPFFAIVAGTVGALSLASVHRPVAEQQASAKPRWIVRQTRCVGRLLAPVVPVALLAAAWPGWVTAPPYGRPSWSVSVDSSLRDAVWEVARYRREGVFGPDSRGLILSPEVADYWSWFGEGSHAGTSGRVESADVAKIQAGILGEGDSGTLAANDWRTILRAHNVNHLILHAGSNSRTEQVVSRLSSLPTEWTLLYLRGRTVVFGWRDPLSGGTADSFNRLRVAIQHRAFLPTSNDRAPLDGPGRGPGEHEWSRAFVEPRPASPENQDEAALYLAYFDGHRPLYEASNRETWVGYQNVRLAGNLALSLPTPGCVAIGLGEWAIGVPGDWGTFLTHQDDGPLGALLLAVRAARRAIEANPDDARSYFLLGEAYLRLAQATRERAWCYQLPAFDRIRQVQAITAFQQAIVLRPDSPAAHGRLARLYRDRGSLDLALVHLEKLVEITKARGPQAGAKSETASEALAGLEREKDALASLVRQRVKTLEVGKENRRVLDLAREASGVGLPKYALEILLKSDASEFGAEGVQLELDLLLWAGRVRDVRAWLDPALEKTIGGVTYHEVLACLAAATGNYREAGQEMRAVAAALLQVPSRLPTPYTQASYDIARAMLATAFVGNNPIVATHQLLVREGLFVEVQQIEGSLGREGNAIVVAGLLALEAGEVAEAEELLHRALRRWQGPAYVSGEYGVDFAGRPVAQDCLRLIVTYR